MINVQGSGGGASLGGAGAVLEVRPTQGTLLSNVSPGLGGWTDGGFMRYGGDVTSLPGLNPWGNGSTGATPQRGYISAFGATWARARNNGAGNTPIDWYCGVMAAPIVEQPAANINQSFAVYEFGAQLALNVTPAAPITRDCGMMMMQSINTSYANVLRAGAAAGNDFPGFGVVFDGLGDLLWIVRKPGTSGGGPLTEQVTLGSPGAGRIVQVQIRLASATLATAAKVEVIVDGVTALTRNWGPGTVLPVAADSVFQPSMGTLRPLIRAGQETATNVELLFRGEYLKAAATAALLG